MKASVLKGHLDGMILAVLEDQSRHGYAVAQELRQRSDGALDLPTGTIYPALHRLERNELIDGEWDPASGRRRRVYSLTQKGQRSLAKERRSWDEFHHVVAAVMRPST